MDSYKKIKAIISGGGTGGHIFPALSIAGELKELNPETEILFVGAQGRMEMEKVPAAGYEIIGLPVAGLQRKLTLSNLALPFKVVRSVRMARKILKDFKPYAEAQKKIETMYRDEKGWAKSAILNVACVGKFSSDRTIQEYVDDIWKLDKVKLPKKTN